MKVRPMIIYSGVVVGLMLALSAWAWTQLPADASVPIHWGVDGKANGFASKPIGLLLLPAMTLGIIGPVRAHPADRAATREPRAVDHRLPRDVGRCRRAPGRDRRRRDRRGPRRRLRHHPGRPDRHRGAVHRDRQLPAQGPPQLPDGDPHAVDPHERPVVADKTHRVGGRLFVLEGVVFLVLGLLGAAPSGWRSRSWPASWPSWSCSSPTRTGSGRSTRRGASHERSRPCCSCSCRSSSSRSGSSSSPCATSSDPSGRSRATASSCGGSSSAWSG